MRGNDLAAELGIGEGPRLGELLEEVAAARYAGEVSTRDEALALARAATAGRAATHAGAATQGGTGGSE
jgi:hypothetical protein